MERYYFGLREQGKEETVEEFVTALRKLASSCKFGVLVEERICDQFVLRCSSDKIREELWLKDEPPLDEVMIIAKRVEHMLKCVSELSKVGKSPSQTEKVEEVTCQAVQKSESINNKGTEVENKTVYTNYGKKSSMTFQGTCYRCGKVGHKANARECPVLKAVCSSCGRRGHFTKNCCFLNKTDSISEVREVYFQINECGVEHPSEWVKVGDVKVKMKFDSCSHLTFISKEEFGKNFSDRVKLIKSDVRPTGYGGTPIKMLGYFVSCIECNGRFTDAKIYVAENGDSLLSWTHQARLGVILNPSSKPHVQVQSIENVENKFVKKFEGLFKDTLGCLKGYNHQIKLKLGAKPFVAKVMRIPISVQEAVQREIDRLMNEGVIESVEATEWLASIVVARKANNEIRLCVDL